MIRLFMVENQKAVMKGICILDGQHWVFQELGGLAKVHLVDPLDYEPFANLMHRSYLILTDSGGVQEEAPAL